MAGKRKWPAILYHVYVACYNFSDLIEFRIKRKKDYLFQEEEKKVSECAHWESNLTGSVNFKFDDSTTVLARRL